MNEGDNDGNRQINFCGGAKGFIPVKHVHFFTRWFIFICEKNINISYFLYNISKSSCPQIQMVGRQDIDNS